MITTAAPDPLKKWEQRKFFKFTKWAELAESEIEDEIPEQLRQYKVQTPQEYLDQCLKNLKERRQLKACVRCGWFEICKIEEVTKYYWYTIYSDFNWKPNTLDKEAIKRKCDICTLCGEELLGQKNLGKASKRISSLTNRPAIRRRLVAVWRLCNTEKKFNNQYERIVRKIKGSENRAGSNMLTELEFREKMEDMKREAEYKHKIIGKIRSKIDELVTIYSLK